MPKEEGDISKVISTNINISINVGMSEEHQHAD